ncbi:MAG: nucleotidyltransferase family protein [Oscillospiraceae bacterium]
MNQTFYDLIDLCKCAVNGTIPPKSRCDQMHMENLYTAAEYHSLTAIAAYALESAGVQEEQFCTAKAKASRKNIYLDIERAKLFSFCEQNGIWYMPLKGCILKEMYPDFSMRQMADNDILFDEKFRSAIRQYFIDHQYTVVSYLQVNHDAYEKPPVLNFEMHTALFGLVHNQEWAEYYKNIKDKLIKDKDNQYGYHFSDEDFYIYIIAHEYKHYIKGGTGLRSLLDCYVFLRAKQDAMDWSYISAECKKLGIADFEQQSRKLAQAVFGEGSAALSDADKQMLAYYLKSGTYGTMKQFAQGKIERFQKQTGSTSRLKYIWYRLFPPMEVYERYYPFFYQHKWLLPVGWGYRLIRGMVKKRQKVQGEMKYLYHTDDETQQ